MGCSVGDRSDPLAVWSSSSLARVRGPVQTPRGLVSCTGWGSVGPRAARAMRGRGWDGWFVSPSETP
jgi:hypothetical protein